MFPFSVFITLQVVIHESQHRPAGSDHYIQTCCPSVCTSVRSFVPTFQNLPKQNRVQVRIVIATGGTVGWPSGSLMTLVMYNFCLSDDDTVEYPMGVRQSATILFPDSNTPSEESEKGNEIKENLKE